MASRQPGRPSAKRSQPRRVNARTPEEQTRYLLLAAGQPARVHSDEVSAALPPWNPWAQPDDHVAEVVAAWLHFRETGNGWLVAEVIAKIVERGCAPPAWALEALAERLRVAIDDPSVKPAAALGLAARGRGQADPRRALAERRRLAAPMVLVARLVAVGVPDYVAGLAVHHLRKLTGEPETFERAWRDDWRPFLIRATALPREVLGGGQAGSDRRRGEASEEAISRALEPFPANMRASLRSYIAAGAK